MRNFTYFTVTSMQAPLSRPPVDFQIVPLGLFFLLLFPFRKSGSSIDVFFFSILLYLFSSLNPATKLRSQAPRLDLKLSQRAECFCCQTPQMCSSLPSDFKLLYMRPFWRWPWPELFSKCFQCVCQFSLQ